MSSIPLAIQSPAAPANPLDQYAKQQGIVSMMQEQKLRQQQTEQNQISLNDQKAGSEAMKNWDGQSLDDLPGLYIKHGASANAVLKLKQDVLDFTSKKTTQQHAQLENEKLIHDNMAGGLDAISSLPVGSQPDALEKFKSNPDVLQGLDQNQRLAFNQSLDGLKVRAQNGEDISADLQRLKNEHLAESQITKNAMDQQDVLAKKNTNEETSNTLAALKAWQAKPENAGKTSADFAVEQARLKAKAEAAGTIQGEQSAAQPGRPYGKGMDVQEANDWLNKPENKGKTLSDYQTFKTEQLAKFNYDLQARGAPATPLQPGQQATVDAVLDGRQSPPTGMALRTPYWQNIMAHVYEADSKWSEQRAQLRKDYTLGKHSNEINAINTALQHTGVLGDAIDALNNGDFKRLNSIANTIGVETGKTPAATFKVIVGRLGPETASAYGVGTGGEREGIEKDFSVDLPPQTLKSNLSKNVELLNGKINSLRNQWDQNKGESMDSFDDRFITKEAKAVIGKWGPQGGANQGGKVLSQAAIAKAAKDHGVSVDEATKQAKAAGYTIQ